MTAVMLIVTYLIGLALVVGLGFNVVRLIRRRQHPLRVLSTSLSNVFVLGVLGVGAFLPPGLWFLWWVLVLAVIAGTVVASWRAVRSPTAASETKPPSVAELVINGVLALAVVLAAVLSG